ncbi:MAG TPA: YcaO-like family protein [Anaerolineae bacterium]|nr:YcaO-like family protein [Anaerolineae bacterium]
MTNKIILNDAFKGFTLDQDKIVPPEETVKRFKEKLKNLDLDILKSTERIDNGRLGIPVYLSCCGKDALSVIGTKKQMGKGATPHQAEASAVMELAERFSFYSFYNNPDNFIIEKYRNLKDRAISFEMIAESVHDDSNELETTKKIFENIPLKWTRAYNLTQNKETLIPFNWFFTINEFNGTSAGNCAEEALIQGICEVVERHTSSIIGQNNLKIPSISADSATEPLVKEMIQKYRNAGIKLYISDFTLDLGIPTVGILAYDPSTFPEKSEIVWTAGTTPDPQKALSRALSEVAQLAGDFNTCSNYVASGLPKLKKIKEAEFITNSETKINITALPDISDNNIKIEVQNCISMLAKKGFEVIIVDTTHPLLKIPAFYTIIPGAHFRERSLGASVGMFSAKLISKNKNPQTAISELKKMDSLLPGKYYIKFYLGSCFLSINDPETALTYFNQALELNPIKQDVASIYSYMGVCLKNIGEYRKALDVLKKGEESDSAKTDIYNLMGFCNFSLKKHEKAIECFRKVLKLDPGSAIDYANIASNYRDMGKRGKAIKYYEIALSIDPEIDFAKTNLEKLRRT